MLTLWGCTVKEETCNAIGKFAVLWSQFEIVYFKNNYNVKSYERIEVIKSSSEIDDLISGIKDTLNSYARETYNVGFTWEEKLCIRKNERNYLEKVNSFLNERLVQLEAQIKICIFICGRIRIPLKQRLERFISNNSFPVEIENTNTNYGQFLFWGIYSVIAQALDVLFLSICYKMIPYIRYRPTFMYLMIILSNMDEKDELLELKYKACIMHVIQKRAELIEFSTDTATFISALKDYRFEYNLFQQLAISGNIKHEFHIQEISNLVDIELEKLLTFCSK